MCHHKQLRVVEYEFPTDDKNIRTERAVCLDCSKTVSFRQTIRWRTARLNGMLAPIPGTRR